LVPGRVINEAATIKARAWMAAMNDTRERLMAFVLRVKAGLYKKPLVVCHGGIIRMLHHAHQRELGHIENASVHEFDL
jgi:broad specificity phosphatase PhoE